MCENISRVKPIKPSAFYQYSTKMANKIDGIEKQCRLRRLLYRETSRMQPTLLGPTIFQQKFNKQAEALQTAQEHSTRDNPLCTFVHQEPEDGRRKFIVAHPEVFWHSFMQQPPGERCAFEVIPEGAPCWLYLDLEFLISLNPNSNGPLMTKTIMDIVSAFLKKYWTIECPEENILNLDSTTREKFSRHLIFCIKDIAFKHNIHAGRFVKSIVNDIQEYLLSDGSSFHDVLSYLPMQRLKELFIETDKKTKIFVDTMVYSKNRHFRIYKATKWGKFSHLELAPECKYVSCDKKERTLGIFLDSLVSFFSHKSEFTLLEFNEDSTIDLKNYPKGIKQNQRFLSQNPDQITSPFPFIDKFIADLVKELSNNRGFIRTSIYYKSSARIIYDILGYRYCANIGRAHKSNNIYYVVDLQKKCYYQKCHDEDDCPDFKSQSTPLPEEIAFLIEEEDDNLFLNLPDTSDDNLSQIIAETSI